MVTYADTANLPPGTLGVLCMFIICITAQKIGLPAFFPKYYEIILPFSFPNNDRQFILVLMKIGLVLVIHCLIQKPVCPRQVRRIIDELLADPLPRWVFLPWNGWN